MTKKKMTKKILILIFCFLISSCTGMFYLSSGCDGSPYFLKIDNYGRYYHQHYGWWHL